MAKPAHGADYLTGFQLAEEDFDTDEGRWDGVNACVADEVDVNDLAKQYLASLDKVEGGKPLLPSETGIIVKAVDEYMAKVERQNNVGRILAMQLDEVSHVRVPLAAIDACKLGYKAGIYGKVYNAVIDRATELLEDPDAEDEGEVAGPPRQNPGGKEPLSYWSSQGTWDAQHSLDLREIDDWVHLEDYAKELPTPINHMAVDAAASRAVAKYLDAIDEDGHEDEWVEQNHAELEEFGHLPSEAYKEWRAGYRTWAAPQLAKAIEKIARDLD